MSKPRKIKPDGADGHRERMFIKYLNSSKNDANMRDVLEMLFYFTIRVRDTRDSAVELMRNYHGDIRAVLNAPPEELCQTDGVGPKSAFLLNLVGTIVDRLDSDEDYSGSFSEASETELIYDLIDRCADIDSEEMAIVFHDVDNRIIRTHVFSASPRNFDTNDMYRLMSLASGFHAASLTILHLAGNSDIYPCASDAKFHRYMSDALQTTGLVLRAIPLRDVYR